MTEMLYFGSTPWNPSTVVQWLTLSLPSRTVLDSIPRICVGFACFPCVCVGFLSQFKNMNNSVCIQYMQ